MSTDDDPAYVAWVERQLARGDLAFVPETLPCYECGGFKGYGSGPERKVVAKGPVVLERFDATQTYDLECGHRVI